MQHKTRKQLRQQAAGVEQKLAELQTPEGMARFFLEKSDDDASMNAFEAELDRLRDANIAEPVEPTEPAEPVGSAEPT